MERIAALRTIVTEKQYAVIDNILVDLFTASLIVQVYDMLNESNKLMYRNLTVARMAEIAFKFTKEGKV